MSKIERLTRDQEKALPLYREKWLKIGLETAPANREEAERGVKIIYKVGGHTPPPRIVRIVWCLSPLSSAFTRYIMVHKFDSVRNLARESVGDSVRNSVGNSVWDSVGDSVWDSVGDSVGDSVWESVRDSVRD